MEKKPKFIEGIEIPEGVSVEIIDHNVSARGSKGQLSREFLYPRIKIFLRDNKVILESIDNPSKREKIMIGTFKSHIKNIIQGCKNGYIYKLKICSSHFPMSVSVEGDQVVIKNFLGEKIPRKTKILPDINVKVEGDEIVVEGIDKEKTGQMAARIEQSTKIKSRDRRIFQDGCYIILKDNKEIR